jgi:hypothetical protein
VDRTGCAGWSLEALHPRAGNTLPAAEASPYQGQPAGAGTACRRDNPRVDTKAGRDAAANLLIAEYQYVSGLIPHYRNVEMLVLAGTGIVATGALAATAALMSGENPEPAVAAIVLAAAAWGPALLLVVEATALIRIRRASLFIGQRLHPIAKALSCREDLLSFEHRPMEFLLADLEARGASRARKAQDVLVAASVGIVAIPVVATLGLAAGGVLIDDSAPAWLIGAAALVCAVALGWYAFRITHPHEKRHDGAAVEGPAARYAPSNDPPRRP